LETQAHRVCEEIQAKAALNASHRRIGGLGSIAEISTSGKVNPHACVFHCILPLYGNLTMTMKSLDVTYLDFPTLASQVSTCKNGFGVQLSMKSTATLISAIDKFYV
jgi:hypothetical protein